MRSSISRVLLGLTIGLGCTPLIGLASPEASATKAEQVLVKVEWISAEGAKKSTRTLTMLVDDGERASSTKMFRTADGEVRSGVAVTPQIDRAGNREILMKIEIESTTVGGVDASEKFVTTATIRNNETRVVRHETSKGETHSDQAIMVTPTIVANVSP